MEIWGKKTTLFLNTLSFGLYCFIWTSLAIPAFPWRTRTVYPDTGFTSRVCVLRGALDGAYLGEQGLRGFVSVWSCASGVVFFCVFDLQALIIFFLIYFEPAFLF